MLCVNADDWGCNKKITDRIFSCYDKNRVHSASAMTFMIDSERAADLARANYLPTGLHLNFDTDYTAANIPPPLRNHHRAISNYLKEKKWNQVIYNPFLRNSFDYIFKAQWDEFCRLYGEAPKRLDGHHHMHLSINMLISGRIPNGIRFRRNFTFYPGEKNPINRLYRRLVDHFLMSRFVCTDAFFSITPISHARLKKIMELSKSSDVELMVHPGLEAQYSFLLSCEWTDLLSERGK